MDHPDADSILAFYVDSESASTIKQALRELDQFLATTEDDAAIEKALYHSFYMSYLPTGDGWPSQRAWLEHVREQVQMLLAKKEEPE